MTIRHATTQRDDERALRWLKRRLEWERLLAASARRRAAEHPRRRRNGDRDPPRPDGLPLATRFRDHTGSGAAVAHVLWEHEVGGSNPPSPTMAVLLEPPPERAATSRSASV